jgi:hypothetical protein
MPIHRRFGFGKINMGGKMFKRNVRLYAPFAVKDSFSQLEETEAAAAFPASGFRYAALFAFDNLFKPDGALGFCLFPHFNADVAPSHFVGNGGGRTGAKETIENIVAGVGGDMNNTLD